MKYGIKKPMRRPMPVTRKSPITKPTRRMK